MLILLNRRFSRIGILLYVVMFISWYGTDNLRWGDLGYRTTSTILT
jgi:hypothetical protein